MSKNEGIELDFQGDRCGKSYQIKRNCIDSWDVAFYDWHEEGWLDLRAFSRTRAEAIERCNEDARARRLIHFLPTRPKCQSNLAAISGQIASAAAASVFGLSI